MFNDPDDLINEAVEVCIQYDRASASLLQRRLSIGYARAARIIDQLESYGVLAQSDGSSKPREVLVKTLKEFKIKNSKIINSKKDNTPTNTVVEYTPIMAEFLDKSVRKLTNPTDLPYLNNNLQKIGNLIIIGNVISKKYEYIKTYLLFLLSKFDLNDVRLIINDSTGILSKFNKIPHLLTPIINSPDTSLSTLIWLNRELDRRIEIMNEKDESFSSIIYICNISGFFTEDMYLIIKRLSSMGAYAKIHLILVTDRLGDIPKMIKDNIPAKLEFNKFGDNEAVFIFKEKIKININILDDNKIKQYLNTQKA